VIVLLAGELPELSLRSDFILEFLSLYLVLPLMDHYNDPSIRGLLAGSWCWLNDPALDHVACPMIHSYWLVKRLAICTSPHVGCSPWSPYMASS